MPTCLIIGGSRGLGLALAQSLHGRNYRVYATVRSTSAPGTFPAEVTIIDDIDLNEEDAGKKIVSGLPENVKLDLVIFNAGLIKKEVCHIHGIHVLVTWTQAVRSRHSINLTLRAR